MKTPLTFLLSLTFLFLYPSISFSQTFKCEFISEKFKGGKTNQGGCTGDPEILFSRKGYVSPRNKHCKEDEKTLFYQDYINYIVDFNKKKITFKIRSGNFILRDEVEESDEIEYEILNIYPFIHMKSNGKKEKRSKTTSYLIVFKIEGFELELIETLYIPQHGNSVISEYTNNVVLFPRLGDTSGVHMRFGKCVNTSN